MLQPRDNHAATLLSDGRVLVTGGSTPSGTLASAEIYDPATGAWSSAGTLAQARMNHTATLLPNGKVLVVGGYGANSFLSSAELYDATTGTWSPAAPLTYARVGHTATVLPSGRVLIAGGFNNGAFPTVCETYEPSTGTWVLNGQLFLGRFFHTATLMPGGKVLLTGGDSASGRTPQSEVYSVTSSSSSLVGPMFQGRTNHTATLLPNGKVLVAGGNGNSGYLTSAELYDPATSSWTPTGGLSQAHTFHAATLLPEGKVLVSGGTVPSTAPSTAELYDPATGAWTTLPSLLQGRGAHTATLLPSGRVLVAGGNGASGTLGSAEVYVPLTGAWTPTAQTARPVNDATLTLLPDGKVLMAGGLHDSQGSLSQALVYDMVTGAWSATGSLFQARHGHTATLLPEGKVLVSGGKGASGYLTSAELYDPATGTWTPTGSLSQGRFTHSATLLPGGKVLVIGGAGSPSLPTSAELYDPATGTWTSTASLTQRRVEATVTLLPNGKVLVAGGQDTTGPLVGAELYDPATGAWAPTGSLSQARHGHTATLLPSGKVLVTGGYNGEILGSAELYDPATGTWTPTASLAQARRSYTATLLMSGKVLVAGGATFSSPLTSAELYDPATGAWTPTASLSQAREGHVATLLTSGRVLIMNGRNTSGALTRAEEYEETSGTQAGRPAMGGILPNPWVQPGAVFTVYGEGFRGLSEASGGMTASSPTDFPLLRLMDVESHHLFAIPFQGFSRTTLEARAPNLRHGHYLLSVTVNGLMSGALVVRVGDAPPAPAPETFITSKPPASTSQTSAFFSFAANMGGVTFECSLDGVGFTPCDSSITYVDLAQGAHFIQVRARDAAGTVDPSPASHAWTITSSPSLDTLITSAPPAFTNQQATTFAFSSDSGSFFTCSLDGAAFSFCGSPVSYARPAEGTHTFRVRAHDSAGNADPTPASHTWTIDLTVPNTSLTSSPSTRTNQTLAIFTFSSPEAGATFQCNLDGVGYSACTSPTLYMDLSPGSHSFRVRALDAAGNVDATPVTFLWTIDLTVPNTTLSSTPESPTRLASAAFSFASTESNSTFTCSLDGEAFTPCTSPASYTHLAAGPHSFQVRARDQAGNVDASPATFLWLIDQTEPETSLTSSPPSLTQQTSATFTFSSEAGATLECSLQGAAFTSCTSPISFTGLAEGRYTFHVRARDTAGNVDATPATHSWSIDLTTPETALTSAPATFSNTHDALFAFTSNKPHATFECSLDGAPFTACTSPVVFSRLPEARHTFQVRARSSLTGVDATPATHSWTPDYKVPETTLLSAPPSPSPFTSATFHFSSNEPAATFECSLDGAPFKACVSPYTVSGLAERQHTFQVRARDAAGHVDASPIAYSWWVQLSVVQPTP